MASLKVAAMDSSVAALLSGDPLPPPMHGAFIHPARR
jgi:hypothetical protein